MSTNHLNSCYLLGNALRAFLGNSNMQEEKKIDQEIVSHGLLFSKKLTINKAHQVILFLLFRKKPTYLKSYVIVKKH